MLYLVHNTINSVSETNAIRCFLKQKLSGNYSYLQNSALQIMRNQIEKNKRYIAIYISERFNGLLSKIFSYTKVGLSNTLCEHILFFSSRGRHNV